MRFYYATLALAGNTVSSQSELKGSDWTSDIDVRRLLPKCLTDTLVLGVLRCACASIAASHSAASKGRERPVCFPRPTHEAAGKLTPGSGDHCSGKLHGVNARQRGPWAPHLATSRARLYWSECGCALGPRHGGGVALSIAVPIGDFASGRKGHVATGDG